MAFGPIDVELDLASAHVAALIAPDPAGLEPRRAYEEYPVEVIAAATPAPSQSSQAIIEGGGGAAPPFPGPPATTFFHHDYDSERWWGKGYELVWSGMTYFPEELPPMISPELGQHVDVFHITDIGRNPNIARPEPIPFGAQTPTFNPNSFG